MNSYLYVIIPMYGIAAFLWGAVFGRWDAERVDQEELEGSYWNGYGDGADDTQQLGDPYKAHGFKAAG